MKQVDTYGDNAEAAMLRGQVDGEVLVGAPEPRNRLAALERRSLERDLAAHDAHEVADDDDPAIAQLCGEVLPAVRGMYCRNSVLAHITIATQELGQRD